MKRFLFSLAIAVVALCSCGKEDATSIEGRWNTYHPSGDGYAFCLILKGNSFDAYTIAWGEKYSGTYTYADNVLHLNITSAKSAFTNVSFDDKGNMITWEWLIGNLDQQTFALSSGYQWYDMSPDVLRDRKEELSTLKFVLKPGGKEATLSVFGLENMVTKKE